MSSFSSKLFRPFTSNPTSKPNPPQQPLPPKAYDACTKVWQQMSAKGYNGGVPPNPRTFQMRQTGGLMDPNQESVLCQASLQNWITNAWTRATQSHLVPPNAQLYEPIDMNLAGRGTIPETYYVERCDNSNTQRARQFLQFLEQGPQSESGAVQGKPPVPQKQAPPGGELPPQQPAWTSMPRFPSPQKSKWGFKSLGR